MKNIHIQMAYQDVRMRMLYNLVVEQVDGDYTTYATEEMQLETLKQNKHILKG